LIDASTKAVFSNKILDAARAIGLKIGDTQAQALVSYLELLIKWNKAYNLTAIRDPKEMLIKHLIDSLSIGPYIKGNRILDVGTGPGLPGIPMAILYPEKKFLLVDSNGKKTRFLTQSKITLGLDNIEILNGRVEDVSSGEVFDQIMSRAFTALDNMVELCKHLLSDNGQFLAMKGLYPENEISAIHTNFKLKDSIELNVPGCEDQRHLIIIERSN
jgi:16S rRNA (guanine527-N7)-methyltransferase